MPGGFNQSSAKAYFATKGFGPGRQDGILVLFFFLNLFVEFSSSQYWIHK